METPSVDEAFSRWLALREPVDAASRSSAVTEAALAATIRAARGADAVHVLDLATGAGSNLRFLVERLPSPQRWLVVDHSPILLTHLVERTAAWGAGRGYDVRTAHDGFTLRGTRLECRVDVRQEDLGTLEADGLFEGRHLVTASALLDLASGRWLGTLADRCRRAGAAALFTIAYDGRSTSLPGEPEDTRVLELFNRHQRTDKGLGGEAAGPEAAAMAAASFTDAGYQIRNAPSDWKVGPEDRALQRTLIQGWATAASAVAPEATEATGAWLIRRLDHVDAGHSRIHVGHQDLAAWPAVGSSPG
jgi:hypothetical protein